MTARSKVKKRRRKTEERRFKEGEERGDNQRKFLDKSHIDDTAL